MPWTVIEHEDEETGELLTHVMPVVQEGSDFKTKEEAEAFIQRVVAAGNPCLTDEEDSIVATYFGHTLSASCPCNPKPRESDSFLYVHNAAN